MLPPLQHQMLRRAEGICVTKLVEISCRIRKDRKKEVVEKKVINHVSIY
jgi:hypothetical protein